MKRYYLLLILLVFYSCIKNDIPYPNVKGEIKDIVVEGQIGDSKIDNISQTVKIEVNEDVDIEKLRINRLIVTENSTFNVEENKLISPNKFPNSSFEGINFLPPDADTRANFSTALGISITTYQTYNWKVFISQKLNRNIRVDNQVGEAVVDTQNKIVYVSVPESQDLESINIQSLDIVGKNTIVTPHFSSVKDFSRPQRFLVKKGNKNYGEWIVEVAHTKELYTIKETDVRAKRAIIEGTVAEGMEFYLEYKLADSSEWSRLSSENISISERKNFVAVIKNLIHNSKYQYRVVVNGSNGTAKAFKTEEITSIPNLDFETWIQSGKNWYPNPVANNYEEVGAYWATGNEGITSPLAGGHGAITSPVEGSEAYKGKSAKMVSITERITLVGAASGNIFIGKYKTNAFKPSASVNFGRPYSGARPDKLVGYYKYKSMPISNGGKVPGNLQKDECHIYIRLNAHNGEEVAFGEFFTNESSEGYKKFEINITYKNKDIKPSEIVIVATSSRYGGVFEGSKIVGQVGHGSTLWVDDFELLYE